MTQSKKLAIMSLALALCFLIFSCGQKDEVSEPQKYAFDKDYKNGPVTFTVKVDRKEITIADSLTLVLQLAIKDGYDAKLPGLKEMAAKTPKFSIRDHRRNTPKLLDNGKVLKEVIYHLDPFLSGKYEILPIKVSFQKKGNKDNHEVESEKVDIAVKSILPEKQKKLEIKDIIAPVLPPQKEEPWYYRALIVSFVISMISILGIFWYYKRNKKETQAPKIPAHEIAYDELETLIAKKLVEKGEIKQFYRGISNVLRHYIENRFRLCAPERTTEEFLTEMYDCREFSDEQKKILKEFLLHCDLVKFAEHRPVTAEIQKVFDTCKEFIAATQEEGK